MRCKTAAAHVGGGVLKAVARAMAGGVLAAGLTARAVAGDVPDFGPHVHILDPATPGLQQRIDDIYAAQQPNHFGPRRDAILLKPGTYEGLRIPVGFYTQVLGLGAHPDDVHVIGDLRTSGAVPRTLP
jgi:hypothetical protein